MFCARGLAAAASNVLFFAFCAGLFYLGVYRSMDSWGETFSTRLRLPVLLMLIILGKNVRPVIGKSICNLCQPGYHERCQMPYPHPFLFLYGSQAMVTPLANGIASVIAGLMHTKDMSNVKYLCLSVVWLFASVCCEFCVWHYSCTIPFFDLYACFEAHRAIVGHTRLSSTLDTKLLTNIYTQSILPINSKFAALF